MQTPCISAMPVRLTRVTGAARRCFIVGISVCPPESACAPSADRAFTASAMVEGFVKSKLCMVFPPDQPLIACHTRWGETGMSICVTWVIPPRCRASITALTTAGGVPIAPASPQPFTPSGLWVQGVEQE